MAIRIVSTEPDEEGRVKIRISSGPRRFAVWARPFGVIIRNRTTGQYERVFVGEPRETTVRTIQSTGEVVESIELLSPTYLVPMSLRSAAPEFAAA